MTVPLNNDASIANRLQVSLCVPVYIFALDVFLSLIMLPQIYIYTKDVSNHTEEPQ